MNQSFIVAQLATQLAIIDALMSKFCLSLIMCDEWRHNSYTPACSDIAIRCLSGKELTQPMRMLLYRSLCSQVGVECSYEPGLVGAASCLATNAMASRLTDLIAKRMTSSS